MEFPFPEHPALTGKLEILLKECLNRDYSVRIQAIEIK